MPERRYGILIASSQFPDEPGLQDLRCPENDVDGIADVLNDAERGNFTETTVLKKVSGDLVISRSGRSPWIERQGRMRELISRLWASACMSDDLLDDARKVIELKPHRFMKEN